MEKVPTRQNWRFDYLNQYRDLELDALIDMYVRETLVKTQRIFKYTGLPDTIPQRDLELLIQCNGTATIAKDNEGQLYAFRASLGGVPNAYYRPTIAIISNPALKLTKQLEIDKECVVVKNDSMYMGLLPLINENAYLLAQCDISFKFAAINSRISAILGAPDDDTYESAKEFFTQIEKGKNIGVIKSDDLYKSIESYNMASNAAGATTSLIELRQYILGSFYNRLGVQAPFNMKREAINSSESALNDDALFVLIDDMLQMRKEGVEKINAMFGTSISVDLDGVWKQLREQAEIEKKAKEQLTQTDSSDTTEEETEVDEK